MSVNIKSHGGCGKKYTTLLITGKEHLLVRQIQQLHIDYVTIVDKEQVNPGFLQTASDKVERNENYMVSHSLHYYSLFIYSSSFILIFPHIFQNKFLEE